MGAMTDVQLLEVSTPEIDDVVRHEDDYGRTSSGGPLTGTDRFIEIVSRSDPIHVEVHHSIILTVGLRARKSSSTPARATTCGGSHNSGRHS